MPKSVNLRH